MLDEPMHPKVIDLLPELADEIANSLRTDGLTELASQLAGLSIWERCKCDDKGCATFYMEAKDSWYGRELNRIIPNAHIPGLLCL